MICSPSFVLAFCHKCLTSAHWNRPSSFTKDDKTAFLALLSSLMINQWSRWLSVLTASISSSLFMCNKSGTACPLVGSSTTCIKKLTFRNVLACPPPTTTMAYKNCKVLRSYLKGSFTSSGQVVCTDAYHNITHVALPSDFSSAWWVPYPFQDKACPMGEATALPSVRRRPGSAAQDLNFSLGQNLQCARNSCWRPCPTAN